MTDNEDPVEQAHAFDSAEWADASGRRWLGGLDRLETMLAPIGEALLAQAAYRPGERVVDIGCGGGWTTRAIARAVGANGEALGLDISSDLIDAARERARADGPTIRFELGDAAACRPEGAPFDRLFSRFGVMFFPASHAAFANIRRMVKRGGRLDMAVWAAARENGWFTAVTEVLKRHVDMPAPIPRAPGPFALADRDYVRDLLGKAGFGEPQTTEWTGIYYIGGPGTTPREAADFAIETMHVGDFARAAGPDTTAAVHHDLIEMFNAHQRPEGVALPAKALLVTAEAL